MLVDVHKFVLIAGMSLHRADLVGHVRRTAQKIDSQTDATCEQCDARGAVPYTRDVTLLFIVCFWLIQIL